MKLKLSLIATLCSLLFFSASVGAEYTCSYDLRLGIVTGNSQVRILGASRTLFQINNGNQLFVAGKLTKLTPQQRIILNDYATGLQVVVPEITLLAKEGVSLVTDNIARIYSGLVGENNDSIDELYASMKKVKYTVKEKFGHSREYYYIYPGKLETNPALDGSLRAQLESGFSDVSGILTALGTFDASEDSEDEFKLRKRARITCNKLKRIEKLETALHKEVPELKKLDVITQRASF
jgi:uncharacterized protein YndB with AHSA1/START domain